MTALREAGKNVSDAAYIAKVTRAFGTDRRRLIYSEELIQRIRAEFPKMKLGIFTRSPRSYATTVLQSAYPSIKWDVVVAYEDVNRTKPYGEGIDKAMWSFGYTDISKVILVGDGDSDIRAAYNAGCVVALDRSSWGRSYTSDNWRSLSRIPDAVINNPNQIIEVLSNCNFYLPELERLLAGSKKRLGSTRFDRVAKFIPGEVGGDNTPFPVFTCGRSFAGYKSLEWRAKWHALTESIHAQKEAEIFPDEWVKAVRAFIAKQFPSFFTKEELVVSVIPHRPGRNPRLEAFLSQLESSIATNPLGGQLKLKFVADLLSYRDGVKSNSNDKLGPKERFENIRDHLYVNCGEVAKDSRILVIDDVSTTGSSLIYAKKYLIDAGALDVTCLSIAMNISNVIYD
jgi:hypothetical protein